MTADAASEPAASPGDPYQDTATEADILQCFRLLLGRNPNPEEWRGHSLRRGEPLAGVVASYLNSLEFHRRGLQERTATGDVVRTRLPGFEIYSAADDAAVGRFVQQDNYEREVTAVFRRLLQPGMGVLDVGANIGYFAMLSASIVGPDGYVLAVEPNPRNARLLEASRRLNQFEQVVLCQTAAGRRTGLLVLNTSHSNGTTSDPAADLDSLLASETVASIRLDAVVPADRRIDLVKIDVEGAEYTALLGGRATLERCRPVIVSEFSPNMMPGISGVSGPHYLQWLIDLGYDLSVIEADGSATPAGRDTGAVMAAYEGRGTDHIDILCEHREPRGGSREGPGEQGEPTDPRPKPAGRKGFLSAFRR